VPTDWTEADIPDLNGRVILVTGANSGIGFEAARAFAAHGAHVVLGCRNEEKARAAIDTIESRIPGASTELLRIDCADLGSVAAAAERFRAGHDRLDVLVNNAGLMAIPHERTPQGYEMQLAVNHLAPFALTAHLLDRLLATPGSRVVAISSQGHRPGKIDFDDLQSERRYSPWRAYFQSKLANLLFTFELQRKLAAVDAPTLAVAAHPGGASTNLGHEIPGLVGTLNRIAEPVVAWALQSAAMGALPTERAATDPTVVGGEYYGPDGLFEQRGHPVRVKASARAHDRVGAARLWSVSADLTGVSYDALEHPGR
jgi:NAD(P)-dependent dehydrogenase (short-subunit alcohol dehydrogenase family)